MRPGLLLVADPEYESPMCLPPGFVSWMRETYAEKTCRDYQLRLLNACVELGCLDEMTEEAWLTYIRPMRPSGKKMVLAAAKCYYRWARLADPTERIPIPKVYSKEVPLFTDAEVRRHIKGMAQISQRAEWAAELLYATGVRVSGLINLRVEDIDPVARTLRIRVAKGSKPYTVPLNRRGFRAAMLLAEYPHDGFLVGGSVATIEQWCRRASETSGVTMWPHAYRHAAASRWAAVTDLRTWCGLMNYSVSSGAALYEVYVGLDRQRMRDAVEAVG